MRGRADRAWRLLPRAHPMGTIVSDWLVGWKRWRIWMQCCKALAHRHTRYPHPHQKASLSNSVPSLAAPLRWRILMHGCKALARAHIQNNNTHTKKPAFPTASLHWLPLPAHAAAEGMADPSAAPPSPADLERERRSQARERRLLTSLLPRVAATATRTAPTSPHFKFVPAASPGYSRDASSGAVISAEVGLVVRRRRRRGGAGSPLRRRAAGDRDRTDFPTVLQRAAAATAASGRAAAPAGSPESVSTARLEMERRLMDRSDSDLRKARRLPDVVGPDGPSPPLSDRQPSPHPRGGGAATGCGRCPVADGIGSLSISDSDSGSDSDSEIHSAGEREGPGRRLLADDDMHGCDPEGSRPLGPAASGEGGSLPTLRGLRRRRAGPQRPVRFDTLA